jgi:uncharacterized Zn finger protein
MSIPKFTEAAIRAKCSSDSFSRGRSYYDRGAVSDLVLRGASLQAEVEGSQYEPYRVSIIFDQGGIASASCTCPFDWGGWCKHIVAVLLTCLHEGDEIETRPTVDTLLADLDAAQLRVLLVGLAERNPDIADALERQVALLGLANAAPQAQQANGPARRTPVDPQPIRRQMRTIMRSTGRYEEYGSGNDVVEEVRELLRQVQRFVEGGDGRSALALLEPITEEYLDGFEDLYDDEGETIEFVGELAQMWAEAVLTADLTAEERRAWAKTFAAWRRKMDDYGEDQGFEIAQTAAEQGWDDPPLRRVLAGEITEQGAWHGEAPHYADELALIRLTILERQGRYQEYLHLAEAEGQIGRYVTMLVKMGRTQEAVTEGLSYLEAPEDALEVAMVLREQGELDGALRIAEHGLSLASSDEAAYGAYSGHHKAQLAAWTADLADGMGQHERAARAAEVAFRAAPSLNAYLKVQELTRERWASIKSSLLEYLRRSRTADAQVDIFLHENLIDDAIAAVQNGYNHGLIERVTDAALTTRPGWVIKTASAQAERIMDAGQAQHYDHAVNWLRRARDAFRAAGRQEEWREYIGHIRMKHGRKYKLMGLVERL